MLSKGRAAVNRIGLGLILGGVLLTATPAGAGILDASWTAPTTNSDGSPLTDLASYRVYDRTAGSPCSGASFFPVLSPTPSPSANTAVSFRLTGLSAGTLYNVAVSAVDTSSSESACSAVASAAARIEFSVSPTGTVNFGTVDLGSFANQTFTVQNTVGGTVSGAAAASAPFSIVSGSPFSLAGLGTTQTVTVRFTPTTPATATTNVSFTADGDTLSRIVTGIGVDATPPTLTVTSPTSNPTFSTSTTPLTLGGTASDNVGVTQVTWTNSAGGNGTATGTTSWTASGIVLQPGSNVLTVTARDAAGNTATDTLTVTFTPTFALTVSKAGTGTGTLTSSPAGITCGATCSASFTSGTAVTLTAAPAAGSTFTGWSGGGCAGAGPCRVTVYAAPTGIATVIPQNLILTGSP